MIWRYYVITSEYKAMFFDDWNEAEEWYEENFTVCLSEIEHIPEGYEQDEGW